MMQGRVIGVALAIGMVAVTLSGCSVPQPAKTSSPKAAPPTATSAPAAQDTDSAPSTRFYTLCSSLVDVDALSDGLTLVPDSPAVGPSGVAAEQTGMLDCTWTDGTPGSGDTSVEPTVAITAVPDAATAGAKAISDELAQDEEASSIGVGTVSAATCHVDSGGLTCSTSILQGDTWVWVGLFGRLTKVPASSTAALGVLTSLATGVVKSLGDPGPAWVAPTSIWAPAPACAAVSADISSAVDGSTGSWVNWNHDGDEDPARTYASFDAGWLSNCAWKDPSAPGGVALTLEIVPGGAWVWDRLGDQTGVTSQAISVTGADEASYRCVTADGFCYMDAIADHTWFQAQLLDGGTADESTKLAAVLASVIASKS